MKELSILGLPHNIIHLDPMFVIVGRCRADSGSVPLYEDACHLIEEEVGWLVRYFNAQPIKEELFPTLEMALEFIVKRYQND